MMNEMMGTMWGMGAVSIIGIIVLVFVAIALVKYITRP